MIVMDNAAFHKGKNLRSAIEQAGHILLFLPPYSPDLNPIEKSGLNLSPFPESMPYLLRNSFKKIFMPIYVDLAI